NVTLTGSLGGPKGQGFQINSDTRNITFDHVNVQGFQIGITVPQLGTTLIQGGTFNNLQNISITPTTIPDPKFPASDKHDRLISIHCMQVDPTTLIDNLKNNLGQARQQYDIYFNYVFNRSQTDVAGQFDLQIGTVMRNSQQLYLKEQAANFVPYSSTAPGGI